MSLQICKALTHFDEMMKKWGKKESYCIVGSLALKTLGGFDVIPHDIDVEVLNDPVIEEKFKMLAEAYGSSYYGMSVRNECNRYEDMVAEKRMKRPITWDHKPYIFEIEGVKVNVWMVSSFSNRYVKLLNGINYALPVDVLDRKFAYRRPKDMAFGVRLLSMLVQWLGGDENGKEIH